MNIIWARFLVSLVLLVLEKFNSNRPLDRFATGLVGALLAMSLVGGFWLEPYMKRLHTTKYAQTSSAAQREFAETRVVPVIDEVGADERRRQVTLERIAMARGALSLGFVLAAGGLFGAAGLLMLARV